jgi:hypothetical protein
VVRIELFKFHQIYNERRLKIDVQFHSTNLHSLSNALFLSESLFYLTSSRVKVMECSARDNYNINELFKTLLALSKIIPIEQQIETNGGPLKRRSSAYVSATSKGKNRTEVKTQISKSLNSSSFFGVKLKFSGRGRVASPSLASESSYMASTSNGNDSASGESKSKPRSR